MPRSKRGKVLKVQSEALKTYGEGSHGRGPLLLRGKVADRRRFNISRADGPSEQGQHTNLPEKIIGSRQGTARMADGSRPESTHLYSGIVPSKPRDKIARSLPKQVASLIGRRASSCVVTEALVHNVHAAPRFLSLLTGEGRLTENKAVTPSLGRKAWSKTKESSRLSPARRLHMLQTLVGGSKTFFELHSLFGISKQAVKRLVKKGLLKETWGPQAVGVAFELSKKGQTHLKELEEAANYQPDDRQRRLIHLKRE